MVGDPRGGGEMGQRQVMAGDRLGGGKMDQ